MSRLQKRMTRAGFPHYQAVVIYAAAELLLPLAGFLAVVSVLGLTHGTDSGAARRGRRRTSSRPSTSATARTLRKKAIRNGLPDALDLLTVCVEAGSALDQALAQGEPGARDFASRSWPRSFA